MPPKSLISDHLMEHEGWLSKKAGSFSKTPQRTVQLWTERGAVIPALHDTNPGTGNRRRYSVLNCIEIGIIKALSDMRVPFKQIKFVMNYLRDKGKLEKYLGYDNGFLGMKINPDKPAGWQYEILCFNDDEVLERPVKDNWGRFTTSGSSDQTLIIAINRIAKKVIEAMA